MSNPSAEFNPSSRDPLQNIGAESPAWVDDFERDFHGRSFTGAKRMAELKDEMGVSKRGEWLESFMINRETDKLEVQIGDSEVRTAGTHLQSSEIKLETSRIELENAKRDAADAKKRNQKNGFLNILKIAITVAGLFMTGGASAATGGFDYIETGLESAVA